MEIISIEPTRITVREGLNRYRTDMGDVEKLAESIQRTRQILPIVITRDYELIDGGRRLAACLLKGMPVKAVFEDVVDDYEYKELELEANLHRKDFTPAEEALAIRSLHELKQSRYGKGGSGTTDGWSITKTAELLGKTRGSIYNSLEMATLIDSFPQLKKAKKKSEIKKAAKALQKLSTAMEGLVKYENSIRDQNNFYEIHNEDCVKHMQKMETGTVSVLLTDPLYGIGADLIMKTSGGKVGQGFRTAGFNIEDPREAAYGYYYLLAEESYRFCTGSAHGYVFVGPEHFWKIRQIFLDKGWLVHVKPLIWIKKTTGQCNIPTAWPSSCYEMMMYIRKEDSKLVKEGMPDWIMCDPVTESNKLHPYEKPVPLLIELLERVGLPGQTMYDPFAGSFSSIEAGVHMNMYSIGVEVDQNAYARGITRIQKIDKKIIKGKKEAGNGKETKEVKGKKQK
jgi:ParB/RepB/Spo0J family partition protein